MNAGDAFGRTIQIIRFDGKSTNLRKAIVHGWVRLQFVSGASAFSNAAVRKKLTAPASTVSLDFIPTRWRCADTYRLWKQRD